MSDQRWIVRGCGVAFICPWDKVSDYVREIIEKGGVPDIQIYKEDGK